MPDNDMGNTITTSTSSTVPFSPPDPTSKSGSAVLSVQKSSDLDFSPSDEDKTKKKTGVLVAHVHAPSRTTTTEKNAVVATNGNSGSQVLSPAEKNANGDDHAMSDDNDHTLIYTDDEKKETTSNALVPIQNSNTHTTIQTHAQSQAVFDRVFTTPHPVTASYGLPHVHAEPAKVDDDMSHVMMKDGKAMKGSFEYKEITIRVDTRSASSHFHQFSLAANRSNNLASLRRVLHRASTLTKTPFNEHTVFHGLKQGRVDVSFLPKDKIEKLKEQIKTATAAAEAAAAQNGSGLDVSSSPPLTSPSPSSLPSSSSSLSPVSPRHIIPSLWTTQYKLHFDTITNTKTAFTALTSMCLSPSLPYPRIITGKVLGFPFTATNTEIEKHLQQHAWYVGGAPSLVITRAMQPQTPDYRIEQPKDECYYSVLSIEYNKALNVPSLYSKRPLTFDQYIRSPITICSHCNQQGHQAEACAMKGITNASGIRDACIMCGSFDHAHNTCPARDDPNATCIICKKGKHTVRACPQYRGTYRRITPNNTKWTGRTWTSQGQQQQQPQQQQQQIQPQLQTQTQTQTQIQTRVQQQQPQRNRIQQHDSTHTHLMQQLQEQKKMFETVTQQNTTLQNTIAALTQQFTAQSQQIQSLTQMMTSIQIQMKGNTNTTIAGSIMFDDDTTETNTTEATPAPAKRPKRTTATATTTTTATASKPQQALNKAQHDITGGTPRLTNFYTVLATPSTSTSAQEKNEMSETDTSTPSAAFNTLMSVTTPKTKQGKRKADDRKEDEKEKEDDEDEPLETLTAPKKGATDKGKKTKATPHDDD